MLVWSFAVVTVTKKGRRARARWRLSVSRSRPNLSLARIICGKQCIVFSPTPLALTNRILFGASDKTKQLF